jgi:hypothetical protein
MDNYYRRRIRKNFESLLHDVKVLLRTRRASENTGGSAPAHQANSM